MTDKEQGDKNDGRAGAADAWACAWRQPWAHAAAGRVRGVKQYVVETKKRRFTKPGDAKPAVAENCRAGFWASRHWKDLRRPAIWQAVGQRI